jgi:hypothetical protein
MHRTEHVEYEEMERSAVSHTAFMLCLQALGWTQAPGDPSIWASGEEPVMVAMGYWKDEGVTTLNAIVTPREGDRKKGAASTALCSLLAAADKSETVVELTVATDDVLRNSGAANILTHNELVQWYMRHGFVHCAPVSDTSTGQRMRRQPRVRVRIIA